MPGQGGLPLTRFLNHLRETGYDHSLVLELSPYAFPEDFDQIRATLEEVFRYLCMETRKAPAENLLAESGTGVE